jgi:hypothetical protein
VRSITSPPGTHTARERVARERVAPSSRRSAKSSISLEEYWHSPKRGSASWQEPTGVAEGKPSQESAAQILVRRNHGKGLLPAAHQ